MDLGKSSSNANARFAGQQNFSGGVKLFFVARHRQRNGIRALVDVKVVVIYRMK